MRPNTGPLPWRLAGRRLGPVEGWCFLAGRQSSMKRMRRIYAAGRLSPRTNSQLLGEQRLHADLRKRAGLVATGVASSAAVFGDSGTALRATAFAGSSPKVPHEGCRRPRIRRERMRKALCFNGQSRIRCCPKHVRAALDVSDGPRTCRPGRPHDVSAGRSNGPHQNGGVAPVGPAVVAPGRRAERCCIPRRRSAGTWSRDTCPAPRFPRSGAATTQVPVPTTVRLLWRLSGSPATGNPIHGTNRAAESRRSG